jgi:hypothetical protein
VIKFVSDLPQVGGFLYTTLCDKVFINNIAENYQYSVELVWFGLWCLMPLSTIFQLFRGSQLMEEIRVSGENHRPVASH